MAKRTCCGRDGDSLACSGRTGSRDEEELHAHLDVKLVNIGGREAEDPSIKSGFGTSVTSLVCV